MGWPSQSPDFISAEMLLQDLRKAVHTQIPKSLNELNQCCKEKWDKTT